MVSNIVPLALLAGQVAHGAVVRRYEEPGSLQVQSSVVTSLAPTSSESGIVNPTITDFVLATPTAQPSAIPQSSKSKSTKTTKVYITQTVHLIPMTSGRAGASMASGSNCTHDHSASLPTNPGFVAPPQFATSGAPALPSGIPRFTFTPIAPSGASQPPIPRTSALTSIISTQAPLRPTSIPPASSKAHSQVPFQSGFNWPSQSAPGASTSIPSKQSSTAVVVVPITSFPVKQSSTVVVVEPITSFPAKQSSTAIVVQPITPSAARRAVRSSIPEDDAHILPIHDKIQRDVVAPSQPAIAEEANVIQNTTGEEQQPSSRKPSASSTKPASTPKSSSRPAPQKSTTKPASKPSPSPSPIPSTAPTPSLAPAPASQVGYTTVISAGKHCPYPYPGEHCGKPKTTFVTSVLEKPKTSGTESSGEKPKETGWCPYPGQKC